MNENEIVQSENKNVQVDDNDTIKVGDIGNIEGVAIGVGSTVTIHYVNQDLAPSFQVSSRISQLLENAYKSYIEAEKERPFATYTTRKEIVRELQSIGEPALQALVFALRYEDDLGKVAAYALADLGEVALDALAAAMHQDMVSVREKVVFALGRLGRPAYKVLCGALSDANPVVREGAVSALEQMGDIALDVLVYRVSLR